MSNVICNECGHVLSDIDLQCPHCNTPVGTIEIFCPKCGFVFETQKGTISKEGASAYLKKSYVCPNECQVEPNVQFTYLSRPTMGTGRSYECDNCGQPISETDIQCPHCDAAVGKIEIFCPKCGFVFKTRKGTLSNKGANAYLKKSYVCPNECQVMPNVRFTYISDSIKVVTFNQSGCDLDDGDK